MRTLGKFLLGLVCFLILVAVVLAIAYAGWFAFVSYGLKDLYTANRH